MMGLENIDFIPLPFEELRIIFALIYLIVFSYFDIKNDRNIPDRVVYALTALSFVFVLFYPNEFKVFALFQFLVVFSVVFLLYKLGQVGLGEAFAFSTLALLFPIPPVFANVPAVLPFVFFIFIFSSLLFAVFVSLYILTKLKLSKLPGRGEVLLVLIYLIFLFVMFNTPFVNVFYLVIVSILFLSSILVSIYKDELLRSFAKKVRVEESLDEVFAYDYASEEERRVVGKVRLITTEVFEDIKDKIKEVTIYKMIPFSPFLLMGLLFSLFFSPVLLI